MGIRPISASPPPRTFCFFTVLTPGPLCMRSGAAHFCRGCDSVGRGLTQHAWDPRFHPQLQSKPEATAWAK